MSQNSKPEVRVLDISDSTKQTAFDNALAQTRYGDKIIYSRGVHALGTYKYKAADAAAAGYVSLVQKRIGPANFEYIAQRTKKRIKE